MRVALFTNKFPGLVNSFISRDIVSLLEAGVDVDLFPVYPPDHSLWRYVPESYRKRMREEVPVHHCRALDAFRGGMRGFFSSPAGVTAISRKVIGHSLRIGARQTAKSCYAISYGATASRTAASTFDLVLAYWGNYCATSALVFQMLSQRHAPFSLFLHAGIDLYRDRIYLAEKLRHAKNIVVVCSFNRDFLQAAYPELYPTIASKIYVHHLGLDLAEYGFTRASRPQRIIGVGRFCPAKGFDVLIRAMSIVRSRGLAVELTLVGDGPSLADYKRLASQLKVTDYIRFVGWCSPEKAKEEIANSIVLGHPSTGLGDAVPTVIKEAMALGTPVVASQVAGIPELLDGGSCGLLVVPGDAESLANALQMVIVNEDLRWRLSLSARVRAEELFDMWKNGRRLARLLRANAGSSESATGAVNTLAPADHASR
ncbi:MAG TPA: glycosyltransferase family 4 protein [Bryobacteraceae bacterium]